MGASTADVIGDIFDELKRYAFNVLQQAVPYVDQDHNDYYQSTYNQLRRIIKVLIGDAGTTDGFRVEGVGLPNDFKINGGAGSAETAEYFFLGGHKCVLSGSTFFDFAGPFTPELKSIHSRISPLPASFGISPLTLEDSAANLTPGELVGRELQPNVDAPFTFTVVGNTINTITVGAGDMTLVASIGDHYRVKLSTPLGPPRTDSVYLNVYLDEIDSTEDPDLLHPLAIMTEAQRRKQIQQTVHVREDDPSHPPVSPSYTDADGNLHFVTKIADIMRPGAGMPIIAPPEVVDLRQIIPPPFSGGSPTGASYVVVGLDATLTDERRLQGTSDQVVLADGGAGGDMTLSLPQSIATNSGVQFGTLGLGASLTDGILHAQTGSAGAVAADGDAAIGVFEASTNGGISILTPDASQGNIFFGSPTSAAGAIVRWQESVTKMTIGTNIAGGVITFNSGVSNESARIDSSGQFGIGTTSPGATLEASKARTADDTLLILSTTGTGVTGDLVNLRFRGPGGGGTTRHQAQISGVTENASGFFGALAFYTSPSTDTLTEQLRITSTGNVGIGTISPAATLDARFAHVAVSNRAQAGNISLQSTDAQAIDKGASLSLGGAYTDAGALWSFGVLHAGKENGTTGDSAGYLRFFTNQAGGTIAERMRITSLGRVGIGTATPEGTLHVHTATAGTVAASGVADDLVVEVNTHGGMSILTPDGFAGALFFGTPSDSIGALLDWQYSLGQLRLATHTAGGVISFHTGDFVERMRLDASGNLGIGTTPTQMLHVVSTNASGACAITHSTADAVALRINQNTTNVAVQATKTFSGAPGVPSILCDGTGTLTAGATDGFHTGLDMQPVYAGAFTLDRHNYINCRTPTGAATVTNAFVMRFDAALGTHKATTALDKTANAKDGTIKINVNGVIKHIQLYAD